MYNTTRMLNMISGVGLSSSIAQHYGRRVAQYDIVYRMDKLAVGEPLGRLASLETTTHRALDRSPDLFISARSVLDGCFAQPQ